jgi:hypothetical protein
VATSCASTVLPSRVGCVGGVFAPRVKTSVSRGKVTIHFDSVADPDPGSGAFLTPGSWIRNRFFPDLGSQIRNPYC